MYNQKLNNLSISYINITGLNALFLLFFLILSGCASDSAKKNDKTSEVYMLREKVEQARMIRDEYQKVVGNASDVNEARKAEAELFRAQHDYERAVVEYKKKLREIEENKKFKKSPRTVYGPLGIAIHLTEWIIEKLYIIY